MLHCLLQKVESAVILVLDPMMVCIEKKPPCLITQPLVLEVLECFGEPVDGAWSLCWLVLDQGESGLYLFPKSSLPSFPMPPAFAGTKGRCWMVRLAARPCGARGAAAVGIAL